jgi:hypothetical protein
MRPAGSPETPPSIGGVHVRRALLLFAIVLGLAAIVASLSRPRDDSGRRAVTQRETTPTASPGTATPSGHPAVELSFRSWKDQTRHLEADQAAIVVVEVDQPGQVEIPDLGLSHASEPTTPAQFDVLTSRSGRYEILFVSATGDEEQDAGTLIVRPAQE